MAQGPIIASAEAEPDYDVIVIGGGVNGTGVARDCALRGLRVGLFEKHDFAFGASGSSSGMIHGGPRYLTSQPRVTALSCLDSGYIQRIAPNLLFRIPFIFPVRGGGARSRLFLSGLDAFLELYDRYQPLKGGRPHTRLSAAEVRRIEPSIQGDLAGAVTFDEWGIDGARLCVLNALDAEEHGARLHVHHEVYELLRDGPQGQGRVTGVRARDLHARQRLRATARVVVNATGAWSPVTTRLVEGADTEIRPGKGVHVVFDRRLSNYAVVARAIDGRQIFLMPWENLSYIGTTDDDYYGDLDDVRATTNEVRYLVQGIARVVPDVRSARVIGTTAGVRPTKSGWGMYEDDLSRDHEIVDHGARQGVSGLYSMIGGKLASYRLFSEEMTDRICADLGVAEPARTHEQPLPGGASIVDPVPLAESFAVPFIAARRLVYRHGDRADRVLTRTIRAPEQRAVVCACEPVLECEVRHACRQEHARTLGDVSRRTRLGLGPCGAMRCAHRAAQIVAEETGADSLAAHHMAADLLITRYRSRAPGLDGAQLRQEELLIGKFVAGGLASVHRGEGA